MGPDSDVQLWHEFHHHLTDNDRVLRRILDRMPVPLLVVRPVAAAGPACRWIVVAANRAAVRNLAVDAADLLGHALEDALDDPAAVSAAAAAAALGNADQPEGPSGVTHWRAFAVDGCRAGLLAPV